MTVRICAGTATCLLGCPLALCTICGNRSEVSWLQWPLRQWAYRCIHTPLEKWARLIEQCTSPQVPQIFALTEAHFRHMFSTLSKEAYFSHRSQAILRLGVMRGSCRFLFLLYKLALHLPCLCSQWYLPTPHSITAGKDAVKNIAQTNVQEERKCFFSGNNSKFSAL